MKPTIDLRNLESNTHTQYRMQKRGKEKQRKRKKRKKEKNDHTHCLLVFSLYTLLNYPQLDFNFYHFNITIITNTTNDIHVSKAGLICQATSKPNFQQCLKQLITLSPLPSLDFQKNQVFLLFPSLLFQYSLCISSCPYMSELLGPVSGHPLCLLLTYVFSDEHYLKLNLPP